MLRAIRMCLWPKMDNGNKTTRLLVSLGFMSGTNFTLGIIPLLSLVELWRLPTVNNLSMSLQSYCHQMIKDI